MSALIYFFYDQSPKPAGIWVPSPGVEMVPSAPRGTPELSRKPLTTEELESREDVQVCRQMANSILQRLKATCDQFGLHNGNPATFDPNAGTLDDSYGTKTIQLDSDACWFHFYHPKLKNQSFYNKAYEHEVCGSQSPYTFSPDQPRWKPEHAVEVATAFLNDFTDRGNVLWSAPSAKYEHLKMDLPKYYEGSWTVSWSRIDGQGHTYASQGARLDISESWGLTSAVFWLGDQFVAQKGTLMSSAVAIAIAKGLRPAMGTPSNDITDYSVKSSELMIVEPYNVGGYVSRLGWVIWLQPIRSGNRFLGYDDGQEVTIDALTGQILGTKCLDVKMSTWLVFWIEDAKRRRRVSPPRLKFRMRVRPEADSPAD